MAQVVKQIRERAPALFSRRSFLVLIAPAFALIYFVSAVRIDSPPAHLQVSARAFPMVVGAALIVSAIVVVWQELREPTESFAGPPAIDSSEADGASLIVGESLFLAEDPDGLDDSEITSWRDFWIAFAALLAMAAFLDNLGFILAAAGLVAGLATYFDRGHLIRNLAVAVGYAFALHYLFDSVFKIYLPSGPLPW
jgi:hypothetical protein